MKRVYKLTPVSLYDVRGLESWLEDMARRGLVLKQLRAAFTTFERGPAQTLRYRAEPFRQTIADDGPPQAMLDLYQDFGWDFVCGANAELLIFSTRDPEAPEPHSDPELQGQLWKKLYRSRRNNFFLELAVTLFLLVAVPVFFFRRGIPVQVLLIETTPLFLLIYLVYFLLELPGLWTDTKSLGLIVKQLEEGVPLDHRSVYPRRRWSAVIAYIITTVLLLVIIVVVYILPLTGGGVRPLDELTAFPALSLAEVEGEGFVPDSFVMDGRDYGNFCALDHYLLCWDQWQVVQTGDIEPDDWRRMEIQWYDLPGWLSVLSVPLAKELLDDVTGLDEDIWWTENSGAAWTTDRFPREDAGFLAVAHRSGGEFHAAAAAAGDKVVLVRYTGQGDLADWLDEIVGMVK